MNYKQKTILILLTVLLCICVATFVSCKFAPEVESFEVIYVGPYQGDMPEFGLGQFDCSLYRLFVTYTDGKVREVPLTIEMISQSEQLKTWQSGEQTITVEYNGKTATFKCRGVLCEFGDISIKDINCEYTGENFVLEIVGDYPDSTVVEYINGNVFRDVTDIDVQALLTAPNYKPKMVYGHVCITQKSYDVSGFAMDDLTITYDRGYHEIVGYGTLPHEVEVNYYISKVVDGLVVSSQRGNGATEIGEYIVEARFGFDNPNYKPIPTKTAKLVIDKYQVDVSPLEQDLLEQSYDIIVYDGTDKRLTLSPTAEIPQMIDFSKAIYTYYRVEGDSKSVIPQGQEITQTGDYQVDLTNIRVYDEYSAEHRPSKSVISVPFTVVKAMYLPQYGSMTVNYDGEQHCLTFDESLLPEFSQITIDHYEYVLNGQVVSTTGVTNAGVYDVLVYFTADPNFVEVAPAKSTITVTPKVLTQLYTNQLYCDARDLSAGQAVVTLDYINTLTSRLLHGEYVGNVSVIATKIYDIVGEGQTPNDYTEISAFILQDYNMDVTIVPNSDNYTVDPQIAVQTVTLSVTKQEICNVDPIHTEFNKYAVLFFDRDVAYDEQYFLQIVVDSLDISYGLEARVTITDENGVPISNDEIHNVGKYKIFVEFIPSSYYRPSESEFVVDVTVNQSPLPEEYLQEFSQPITVQFGDNPCQAINDKMQAVFADIDNCTVNYLFTIGDRVLYNNVLGKESSLDWLDVGTYTVKIIGFVDDRYYLSGLVEQTVTIVPTLVPLPLFDDVDLTFTYQKGFSKNCKDIADYIKERYLPYGDISVVVTPSIATPFETLTEVCECYVTVTFEDGQNYVCANGYPTVMMDKLLRVVKPTVIVTSDYSLKLTLQLEQGNVEDMEYKVFRLLCDEMSDELLNKFGLTELIPELNTLPQTLIIQKGMLNQGSFEYIVVPNMSQTGVYQVKLPEAIEFANYIVLPNKLVTVTVK